MDLQVFIGWDARSRAAWQVCERSIQHHVADYPVAIRPVGRQMLEHQGVYRRPTLEVDGKRLDQISKAFCSTDFSLARFWVPHLAGRAGWALYCDSDFLFRADVREIVQHFDPTKAVMVVPHKHEPADTSKMNAQQQTSYFRKNWSSLIAWNLAHAGVQRLSLYDLNHWHKHDLHGFRWLAPNEIGFLPEQWNWLSGVSPTTGEKKKPSHWWQTAGHLFADHQACFKCGASEVDNEPGGPCPADPKAVHFTKGTPDMPGYENSDFADEWRGYLNARAA